MYINEAQTRNLVDQIVLTYACRKIIIEKNSALNEIHLFAELYSSQLFLFLDLPKIFVYTLETKGFDVNINGKVSISAILVVRVVI